jgi:hypothetical protein
MMALAATWMPVAGEESQVPSFERAMNINEFHQRRVPHVRATCPAEESIVDYCLHEAKGRAQTQIALHLERCPDCRTEVEALSAALRSKLGLPGVELPPFRGG